MIIFINAIHTKINFKILNIINIKKRWISIEYNIIIIYDKINRIINWEYNWSYIIKWLYLNKSKLTKIIIKNNKP